jgi:antitoxin VapB
MNIATQREAMALNTRSRETEGLAAALAEATGETKTEAVRRAVAEKLERVRLQGRRCSLVDDIGAARHSVQRSKARSIRCGNRCRPRTAAVGLVVGRVLDRRAGATRT